MIKFKYEVHQIPLWFKPFFYLTSYLGAYFITFYKWAVLQTCTIIVKGEEYIDQYPGRIESVWHYKASMYWLVLRDVKNYVQFSHPLWFMYKIILALRWHGCKVILGSTGHDGREAADKIVEEIKNDYACCITPDGPIGPFKKIKKGVLYMSIQSGVPVVPVQIQCSNDFPLWYQWDKKRIPFFFSTVIISYQEPMFVTKENFDECNKQLAIAMGD
jgi:lysophospholipid acyltransferase (LPLAT)-like uncharacterized protein